MCGIQDDEQGGKISPIENFRDEKRLKDEQLIEAWAKSLKKIFKVTEDEDLSKLHVCQEVLVRKPDEDAATRFHRSNVGGRTLFGKRYHDALNNKTKEMEEFQSLYETILRKHCAPNVGLEEGSGEMLLYQRNPTLRVMYPDIGKSVGKVHKDADYHHQATEINFWVPFVDLSKDGDESACLYAESSPGKQDFHPFDCHFGEFVKFWGNQVTHYTIENVSKITRVSVDFRVIRLYDFDANPEGKAAVFRRNEYYAEIVI